MNDAHGRDLKVPSSPTSPRTHFSLALDARQAAFNRIAGRLTEQINEGAGLAVTNTARGYYASAVDLGALQEILAGAIECFNMTEVRDRWNEDLFDWFRKSLLGCVQRCKEINFDLAERGVRVTLETQDDHGYYRYEFDVFPGK